VTGVDFWILFAELKRRNVYKIALAHSVVGWRIFQIATASPFGLLRSLTIFSASVKLPAASQTQILHHVSGCNFV
jgi:hypothetical protein